MTDAQFTILTGYLDQLLFLVQSCAVVLCLMWGCYLWRLGVLAKNQRTFW